MSKRRKKKESLTVSATVPETGSPSVSSSSTAPHVQTGGQTEAAQPTSKRSREKAADQSNKREIYPDGNSTDNSTDDIMNHLTEIGVHDPKVSQLSSRNERKSFKLIVPEDKEMVALMQNKWPRKVILRPFHNSTAPQKCVPSPVLAAASRPEARVNTERDVGLTTTIGHPNPGSTATITDDQPILTTNTESITGDKTNPGTTVTTTTSTNTVSRDPGGLENAQVPTLKTVTSSGTSEVTTRDNSGSVVSVS